MPQDSGQLTFKTMGGDTVVIPKRGKHYVEPRGYAAPPGTGPAGEKCGTCKHSTSHRRWIKCDANRSRHTSGRGSDILARSPACSKWECKQ